MGGSFGLELNPDELTEDESAAVPGLIRQAEEIAPIILKGDMYRLKLPEESNFPAVLFVSEEGDKAVLFAFQVNPTINHAFPRVRLQGLDEAATFKVEGFGELTGKTLMNMGLMLEFDGEYSSKVLSLERV